MPVSTGITASLPYVNVNVVSPVGIFMIFLYAHRTRGNSSAHAPFLFFQSFLYYVEHGLIGRLNLPIALREPRQGALTFIPSFAHQL